jgi:hypothetical protein
MRREARNAPSLEGCGAEPGMLRRDDNSYSTRPIFFTAAIRRALSASTKRANSGAS